MVDILCVLFVMFMVFAMVLWYFLQDYSEWRKYSKGKPYWEKDFYNGLASYAYRVPYTKEEIIGILSLKRGNDKLYYCFNRETLQIRFANPEVELYGAKDVGVIYQLKFQEEENGTLLYVEQIEPSLYNGANRVLLLMDAFWAEKVSAETLR